MAVFVRRSYLLIDGTQVDCEDITATLTIDGHGKVNAMNRRKRALGYSGGNALAELKATIPVRADMPINLKQMLVDETQFSTIIEHDNGKVDTFFDCKLTQLEETARHGDKHTFSASIDALDFSFD